MTILREGVDTGIGTRAMARPNRRSGELLAAALLLPGCLPRACEAAPHFGSAPAQAGPLLAGYAAGALARPDLALLAARSPRGRALLAILASEEKP